MIMYYWENPVGMNPDHGKFMAKNDAQAIKKMPKTAIVLYKESDTKTGKPFIIIKERNT